MRKLFISYAHVDKWQVKALAEILETANYNPWYDHRLKTGQDWKQQLADGIHTCDAFVYALTPESIKSEWCQWEFKQALEQLKPIVPVLFQTNTQLPDYLKPLQYADFTEGPNTTNVAKLIGDIQEAISHVPDFRTTLLFPENPSGIPGRATNQHVFISYSKKNQSYARQLTLTLRDNGFNVWIDDEINYGEDWWDVVEQAITDCGAFIVIMSPESASSRWVKREILLAEKWNKSIFPLLSSGDGWSRFLEIQYADVRNAQLPGEDFMLRLARHIPRLQSVGENVTPDLKQAAEVARKQATRPAVFVSYAQGDAPIEPYMEALRHSVLEIFQGDWVVKDGGGLDEVDALAKRIERSELHITFLGALYGESTPIDDRSRTHLEYDIAKGLEVSSLAIILPDTLPHDLTAAQIMAMIYAMQKQQDFREYVKESSGSNAIKVTSVEDFSRQINHYLSKLKKEIDDEKQAKDAKQSVQPTSSPQQNTLQQTQNPIALETRPRSLFFSDDDQSHTHLDERTLFKEIYKLSILDEELLQFMVQQPLARQTIGSGRFENLGLEAQLERMGLMRQGMLLYGTFLCFGRPEFLRDHLGGLQMVIYDNIKRGATNSTNLQLAQTNLIRQFDAGMDFMEKNSGLQRAGNIGTANRDELEIPVLALREALANGIVHRSYTTETRHDPTRIEVYPDRLEITSFGAFMSGITAQKLTDNPEGVHSRRRNPIIARIFQYMAYVELNASGVSRIFSTTSTLGLKKPEIDFDSQDETVRVLFYRRSRGQMMEDEIRRLSALINSTDRERIESGIQTAESSIQVDAEFAGRFTLTADLLKAQRAYLNAERFFQSDDLSRAQDLLTMSLPSEADDALVQRIGELRQRVKTELERRRYIESSLLAAETALKENRSTDALVSLRRLETDVTDRERRNFQLILEQGLSARTEEIVQTFENNSLDNITEAELEDGVAEVKKLGQGITQTQALARLNALRQKIQAAKTQRPKAPGTNEFWKTTQQWHQSVIKFEHVYVRGDKSIIVKDFHLVVYENETLVLYGPYDSSAATILAKLNDTFKRIGKVDEGNISINKPVELISINDYLNLSSNAAKQVHLVELDEIEHGNLISVQEKIGRIRASGIHTSILATNNSQLAMAAASRIAMMSAGELQQVGSPKELYYAPQNLFVAGALGSPSMNFFDAVLKLENKQLVVDFSIAKVPFPAHKSDRAMQYVGKQVILGIRPADIHVADFQPPGITPAIIESNVDVVEHLGRQVNLYVEERGYSFIVQVDPRTNARIGSRIQLVVNMDKIFIFDAETKQNIGLVE